MELESGIFQTEYGRKIPYRSNIVPGFSTNVLLCLHGFGGDKESSVISAFAKVDCTLYDVVAFDWPAHGASDADDEELTVENCLKDLDAMVGYIKRQKPSARISCFATSFGGYIATLYRNSHPGVFSKLILRSPALKMDKVFRGLVTDEEFDIISSGGRITMGFERKMQIGKAFWDSIVANRVYDVTVADPLNVMIIQGDKDDVVDVDDIQEYADKNGILLRLFSGADHRYKRDGELQRIIYTTQAFLETWYYISIYGDLFLHTRHKLFIWNEDRHVWTVDMPDEVYRSAYSGICGREDWEEYKDLKVSDAWDKVKKRGGTWEGFWSWMTEVIESLED